MFCPRPPPPKKKGLEQSEDPGGIVPDVILEKKPYLNPTFGKQPGSRSGIDFLKVEWK